MKWSSTKQIPKTISVDLLPTKIRLAGNLLTVVVLELPSTRVPQMKKRMDGSATLFAERDTTVLVLFAGKTAHQSLETMELTVQSRHLTAEALVQLRSVTTVKSMASCGTQFAEMDTIMQVAVFAHQIASME